MLVAGRLRRPGDGPGDADPAPGTAPRRSLDELRTLGGNAAPRAHAPGCARRAGAPGCCASSSRCAAPTARSASSFEIAYGHAFKAAPRLRAGEPTTVSLRRHARDGASPRRQARRRRCAKIFAGCDRRCLCTTIAARFVRRDARHHIARVQGSSGSMSAFISQRFERSCAGSGPACVSAGRLGRCAALAAEAQLLVRAAPGRSAVSVAVPAVASASRRCSGPRARRLVMPFAGVELLAVGAALLVYARHAADRESIRLRRGSLTVERISGPHVEQVEFAACVGARRTGGRRPLVDRAVGPGPAHLGRALRAPRTASPARR